MKNFFIISFYLFSSIHLVAQNFIPLENSGYQDYVKDIQELANGNFIYLQTYLEENDEEKLQNLLIAKDSIFSTVKLVNKNFQLLAEYPIKTVDITETISGVDILPIENGFLIFGFTFPPFSSYKKMFLLELDEDFNEVRINIFAHSPNIFLASNPIINYDNNFVIIGTYNNISGQTFLAEFDFGGNLLNILEASLGFTNDFIQLPNSSYRLFFRISSKTNQLAADWSGFSEDLYHDLGLSFSANNNPRLLEDGRWLFSGINRIIDSVSLEEINISQALTINPDSTINILYQNRSPDNVSMSRGFYTLDMIDTSCIYFSNAYVGCPSFLHLGDSCFNYVSIHNIQLNGLENWTQYLGFDAAYFPIKILATQDGGVLLLVYRYNEVENMNDEGDMYFIKLDKEGNVNSPVGTEDEESPFTVQQFLVYPNPARDLLRYTFGGRNISSPIIKIFDSAGSLLLIDEILDKETDISPLVPGYYFYEISDKNKRLQTGNLVKE